MQSGKYRHKVTLQRRVDSQQDGGQVVHSYADFAKVRARISPIKGREFIAAQQIQADVTTEISIRYRGDVDETCRIKHITNHSSSPPEEEFFDIVAVMPDDKTARRELRLMCMKWTADGWRNPR